jgi:hypothetical protein
LGMRSGGPPVGIITGLNTALTRPGSESGVSTMTHSIFAVSSALTVAGTASLAGKIKLAIKISKGRMLRYLDFVIFPFSGYPINVSKEITAPHSRANAISSFAQDILT